MMETRAPYLIVGALICVIIGAAFGFVYWLHNVGGLGPRATYSVRFNGSVPGLLVGAGVLFNGIRVGEVTSLSLVPDDTHRVDAKISVAVGTPVRRDTKVSLEFQGLTGVPVIALEGGEARQEPTGTWQLVAEPGAGQSMTQAARDALRRMDTVLADNSSSLQATISNLRTFSDGLARNTNRIDGILGGLERMTGGGAAPPKAVYDLKAIAAGPALERPIKAQVVVTDPTSIVLFDTQRILIEENDGRISHFEDAQWADTIPKLIQEKLIQSFENLDIANAPVRATEGINADYKLMIDIRRMQIITVETPAAEIALSVRLVGADGKVIASRIFQESSKIGEMDARTAASALNEAFAALAREIISWTSQSL